ncbi:MAG TPA: response regulator [Polyangiaceae bacterium]|jgi:two-component system OmpR family response regulator|nr:response regulator [Polyangiaceae bacterium]
MAAPPRRILIVEDDPAIADMLSKMLVRFYDVRAVHDGGAAITTAAAFRPDVILLDVNLPNMDGFAIAQGLKGSPELSRIPIIFLTAQDRSLDVVKGIQVGAKHYITKPFKMDDVIKKVRRLIP